MKWGGVISEKEEQTMASSARIGSQFDKETILRGSLQDQLAYKNFYLREAAILVKNLRVTTSELLDLCNSSQGQEFTIILRDVVELARGKGNLTPTLEQQYNDIKDAFIQLGEENYNISIYIPNTDILSNTYSNTDYYIFEQTDDSSQLEFEYYSWDGEKEFNSEDSTLTEEEAQSIAESGKALLIFGLQSTALDVYPDFPNTAMINPIYITPIVGGSTQNPPANTNTNKHMWMGNMTVKSHKESWVAGESEIAIQMYKYENYSLQKINLINSSTLGNSENIFAEYKRKHVKNHTQKYLNAKLAGMINTASNVYTNSKFLFVIYEADSWPVTAREVSFTYPNNPTANIPQTTKIHYGSSDSYYYTSNQNNLNINAASNADIYISPFLN